MVIFGTASKSETMGLARSFQTATAEEVAREQKGKG